MLPHPKSTILRCTLNVITRQQALRVIFKAHCYTDCYLSVSTYVHAEAQIPLGQFVVNIFYKYI